MKKGPEAESLRAMVLAALEEDAAGNDVTVDFLGVGDHHITAKILAGAPGVLCGMDLAEVAFATMDKNILFERAATDGDALEKDQLIARIEGRAGGILSAERVALNFLQRLSGVATLTSRYVEKVSGTDIRILDTRKTTPLLRAVEKHAVRTGGGHNHRFDLREMILIKENHTRSIGGVDALLHRLQHVKRSVSVEVEVDSLEFLDAILGAPFDRVMLDNFSPAQVERAVRTIDSYRQLHPDYLLEVEVSGGIDLTNIAGYAIQGVDFISIGALTHSAPGLDMSMEFD